MTDHYTPRTEEIPANPNNPVAVVYLLANLIAKILGKEIQLVRATKLSNVSVDKMEETTEFTIVVKAKFQEPEDH